MILVVVLLITGLNYNQSQNKTTLSDLALTNVEALANNENYYKPCVVTTINSGSGNYFVRKCSSCSYISADFFGGDSYCGTSSDL